MKKRFETRRAVRRPIEVITSHWDEPIQLQTNDLSPRGAYIKSDLMPGMGEHIICSFKIGKSKPYDFFAQVVSANLKRRSCDVKEAGFGVEFLDSTPLDRIRIRDALRGTPPPAPVMRKIPKGSKGKRRV